MRKFIVILSLMIFTSLSYGKSGELVSISNGTYLFVSGQGEQVQITIRGPIAIIDLGYGNVTTAKLVRKSNGDKYYKNSELSLSLAFINHCSGYIRIGSNEQILYNTVPICN